MPIDGEQLPALTDIGGLLSNDQKADELGITTRALYKRRVAATNGGPQTVDYRPAGRLVGLGDHGHVYWHPSEER